MFLLFLPLGLLAAVLGPIAWIQFVGFLISGDSRSGTSARALMNLVTIFPLFLLISDFWERNDCCSGSAIFSPDHRLSVAVVAGLCVGALIYSTRRNKLAPPLLEVIINCLLVLGIRYDVIAGIQESNIDLQWLIWVFGVLPVAFQFSLALIDNHRLAVKDLADQGGSRPAVTGLCCRIIVSPYWRKIPLLLLLCLPFLTLLVAVLLIFGQKPDSLVRAFTDTYKHGFSQLDYKCAGVVCDGHFLCTIAAKGDPRLVKPIRVGIRAGQADPM